jgi:hypothetical protein
MKKPVWQKLAAASADPVRVKHFLAALAVTEAGPQLEKYSADQIRVVVALLSGSQALGNLLVANPGWLSVLDVGQLKFPRRAEGFRREIEGGLKPKPGRCRMRKSCWTITANCTVSKAFCAGGVTRAKRFCRMMWRHFTASRCVVVSPHQKHSERRWQNGGRRFVRFMRRCSKRSAGVLE